MHPSPSPLFPRPHTSITHSIHRNNRSKPLHRLHNLLALVLRHPILHQLGRALDKLLTIHQTQSQHALDLFYDFRFGARVEGLEREGEEGLFLHRGGGFFFFDGGGGGWCGARGGGGEAHGHVGDVEAGLGGLC